jgi:sulfate adenylyltransferase subunit 1
VIEDKLVKMNDIAHIKIKTSKPLKHDLYAENRVTGSLVIIDEATYETVGAGMIVDSLEEQTFVI